MTINPKLKIIADHLRSSSFLIADGILPSNEGRGYVLRRIMRRAMLQLHKIGVKEVSMHKMVDILIAEMGETYGELKRAREVIIETLKNEEEKFRETLTKGLKILEEEIEIQKCLNIAPILFDRNIESIEAKNARKFILGQNISQKDSENLEKEINKPFKFSGEIAFKLYDTYGFPLDLTQDILKEKNIEVDLEAFEKAMKNQRATARQNWAGSGEESQDNLFFKLKEKFGETKFLGYETLENAAEILYINEGKNPFVILNQTPFYATSGGQKCDIGKFITKNNEALTEVLEVKKFADGLFVHFIKDSKNLKIGNEIIAKVDEKTRKQKANNHSATHLLHKALKEILGNFISQKGSNVDSNFFTFDFNFNRAVEKTELSKIENLVNFYIWQNSEITTKIMKIDKARENGAEALFGEKYDDEVRVLSMGLKENNKNWSIELCGGTHAKRTGDIGIFKIISEGSVASGIRRITAKTGEIALNFLEEELLKKQEELAKKQEDLKGKDKEIEALKKQILLRNLDKINFEKISNINFVNQTFDDVEAKDIREIINQLKTKKEFLTSTIFAIFGTKDEKVSICTAVSGDLLDKFDAVLLLKSSVEAIGGKNGGGKKDLAMSGGNNKNGINDAVKIIKELIV